MTTNNITQNVILRYSPDLVGDPIVYLLVKEYDLVPNIIKASVNPDKEGYLLLGLTGEKENYKRAVERLQEIGISAVSYTHLGDWDKAEPLVKELIDAGSSHVHLDLIAGLPCDTPQGFAASFHRLHQLNADYLQFGFLKVLPGSVLELSLIHIFMAG